MDLEERWAMFAVEKGMDSGTASLRIRSVEGYYDEHGGARTWVPTEEKWTNLTGDQFMIAAGLRAKDIFPDIAAITDPTERATAYSKIPLVELLERVIYGVVGETIRMTATVNVTAQDGYTQPLPNAHVTLTAHDGTVLYSGPATPVTVPASLGVRLDVELAGYEPYRYTYSVLQGNVNRNVTLNYIPLPEPEPEPEPDPGNGEPLPEPTP